MTSVLKAAWEACALPLLVEKACRSGAILEERRRWIPRAEGEVIEIGAGSGLNFAFYDPERVTRVAAVEPSAPLRAKALPRASASPVPIEVLSAHGEVLPFDSGTFDTAVVTYTLCSVESPRRVLDELRRVLRPSGTLVFVEHGAAPDAGPRAWQARLTPVWRHVAGNCHLDRDVRAELDHAGFRLDEIDAGYAPEGTRLTSFTSAGIARPG